jgi:hypothetical protein
MTRMIYRSRSIMLCPHSLWYRTVLPGEVRSQVGQSYHGSETQVRSGTPNACMYALSATVRIQKHRRAQRAVQYNACVPSKTRRDQTIRHQTDEVRPSGVRSGGVR